MTLEENKLDNPVWFSLSETHQQFSIEYDGAKFYNPEYCPFGCLKNKEAFNNSIDNYATKTNSYYVVGNIPDYKGKLTLNKNLICNQMVLKHPFDLEIKNPIVELKTPQQKKDLFDLVNLIQPGYFNHKTIDLGNYYGIYNNDQLVAVTGERMKMNSFTEVSAVVTHHEHTGKGYAKQLIKHTTDQIFKENKIPYLHVAETNIGAIKLYEKLGFSTRRKISFWNFIKK